MPLKNLLDSHKREDNGDLTVGISNIFFIFVELIIIQKQLIELMHAR